MATEQRQEVLGGLAMIKNRLASYTANEEELDHVLRALMCAIEPFTICEQNSNDLFSGGDTLGDLFARIIKYEWNILDLLLSELPEDIDYTVIHHGRPYLDSNSSLVKRDTFDFTLKGILAYKTTIMMDIVRIMTYIQNTHNVALLRESSAINGIFAMVSGLSQNNLIELGEIGADIARL